MKKLKLILSLFAVLSLMAFTALEIVNWKVKDNYAVTFKGGKIKGSFKGLKAIIAFDEAEPAHSKIWASIAASSIETGMGMKDKHAMAALDAQNFPLIIFESSAVSKNGTGYEATGKLTLKGVTKDLVLPFTLEAANGETVFKGRFSILTKDFNITRSGSPEQVDVELTIPVSK